jgi:hypothetical protein
LGNGRERITLQQIRIGPRPRERPAPAIVADLAHLRRNGGPEITINAVLHAPADPRPPMSVLVRDRVWSEKCQQQSFRHDVCGCRDHRIVGKVPIHDIGRRI